MGGGMRWRRNSGYFVKEIILLNRPTAPFLTQCAASCLRSASLVQCVGPPQTVDGKMAMEDGDMDADMDMLSDEELERYCEVSPCCQWLKYSSTQVSRRRLRCSPVVMSPPPTGSAVR